MEETIRTSGTPFWSASTTARRGDVRRSRNETIGYGPNRTPSRNKTTRPRPRARSRTLQQRPLNRKTRGDRLSDRLTPPTIPQPTADHPEHTVERGEQESQTDPEKEDTRVDDEPLHCEVEDARASVTTTRKPPLGAHATRVVERARKRNAVAETHFNQNLSH